MAFDLGDEQLLQVAQQCVNSAEKHLFVVGPSRSGKSTRLPVILAALSGKRIVSVQPDGWAARYHAEWVQNSVTAGTFDGKRPSVGYYADHDDMPTDFIPQYDVNYMSYRWMYRMVVAINASEPHTGLDDDDYARASAAQKKQDLEDKRRQHGNLISHVILDEVHEQSVAHELGYLAVYAATCGALQPPIGVFEGTKIILATAYQDNTPFFYRFGLSKGEVTQQTITMETGLAPTTGNEIQERFLDEDDGNAALDEHSRAVRRARDILKANPNARILLFMDTKNSSRNIARQGGLKAIDLETESGRNQLASTQDSGVTILATPSFASRIPVEGITDVICSSSLLHPCLHPLLNREILSGLRHDLWHLTWAKNHLDRSCDSPTIHYMFPPSEHSKMCRASHPRWFFAGDLVDILLGLIRLCPEYALPNPTHELMRYKIPMIQGNRALRQLMVFPEMLEHVISTTQGLVPTISHYQISSSYRMPLMLKLVDRCGLDRRQAFFFGRLEDIMINDPQGVTNDRFVGMVAVAIAVFDESPILRQRDTENPDPNTTESFKRLQDVLYLGKYQDYTSDAWINAMVWMDIKQRAAISGGEITSYSGDYHPVRKFKVDRIPLLAAEAKLRLLARMIDLDEESQDALCDGSFLEEVREFNKRVDDKALMAVEIVWTAYFEAYQYNSVFVEMDGANLKVTDISTHRETGCDPKHLAINLSEQAFFAKRRGKFGFYATGSILLGRGILRSVTVIPLEIVRKIMEGSEDGLGIRNLHEHLKLS
ncbi:hypothetical protein GQX73_g4522 [Xylaria multiplex]|uniref:Uncharacterized protein n=1 Tax=Xylaria multiplex TaxID=323545 RepID=A0A7C8MVH3_9PEZI|nr:hypothetical protein GQX73_g4522 [Xylaria multiplex]